MVDITDKDIEYKPINPLAVDSPVLMVEVDAQVRDLEEFIKRSKVLKRYLYPIFPRNYSHILLVRFTTWNGY